MKEQIERLMQINSSLVQQSVNGFRPGPEGAQFGAHVRPPAPPGLVPQSTSFEPFNTGATREQLIKATSSTAPSNSYPVGSPSSWTGVFPSESNNLKSMFDQMQRQHDAFREGICGGQEPPAQAAFVSQVGGAKIIYVRYVIRPTWNNFQIAPDVVRQRSSSSPHLRLRRKVQSSSKASK